MYVLHAHDGSGSCKCVPREAAQRLDNYRRRRRPPYARPTFGRKAALFTNVVFHECVFIIENAARWVYAAGCFLPPHHAKLRSLQPFFPRRKLAQLSPDANF